MICSQTLVHHQDSVAHHDLLPLSSGVEYGQHDLFSDSGPPPGQCSLSRGLQGPRLLWGSRQHRQGNRRSPVVTLVLTFKMHIQLVLHITNPGRGCPNCSM